MDFDMLDDFWSLQQRPNNISGFREFDTPRWRFAAKPVPRLHHRLLLHFPHLG
jgi:hypothetical protein